MKKEKHPLKNRPKDSKDGWPSDEEERGASQRHWGKQGWETGTRMATGCQGEG